MKSFFENLFGRKQEPPQNQKRAEPVRQNVGQREYPEFYKKGDVIGGKYEVRSILGKGGFGVVYLVYIRATRELCALKTFRDELLPDRAAREAFKKEALSCVNLETHPCILFVGWVDEVSGRLFIVMDPIAPDSQGRVSLADHLAQAGGPLDTNQTLKWAIQFCLGMEHAVAHGIQCHRDIKPANILITQDGTLKISDFGLAAAAEAAWRGSSDRAGSLVTGGAEVGFGFSLMRADGKVRCGTPGYIAPEVYRLEGSDIRSDIYTFGLVLWQMVTGSRVPPWTVPWRGDMEGYLQGIYEQQIAGSVSGIQGPLGSVIECCLRTSPSERFGSFEELRGVLEPIWKARTGRNFEIPQMGDQTAGFWNNKGASFTNLARYEEAIGCFDKALAIDVRFAPAWDNKGSALQALARHEEAINCHDEALAIDPRNTSIWTNKGIALQALGQCEEAIICYNKALAISPRDADVWTNKGGALIALGRHKEAIGCLDKALASDARCASAWSNKGAALYSLGHHEEAIGCCDEALAIDPLSALAWLNKGNALQALGRHEAAIGCFEEAMAIDPRDARPCYNKGNTLQALALHEEAIGCYDLALAIDPRDARVWCNKALSEEAARHWREAVSSYRKFVELSPPQYAQQIAAARQRVHELESKGV
jgi:tetratricopeptide (TPR) repeat protein